jgi:hypothetical protein
MTPKRIALTLALGIAAALYSLLGLLQAASLYTGARAELNLQFWGGLFAACSALSLGCAVFLLRKRFSKAQYGQDA